MAETDKPADAKPIADVAHPGKSAPSGNSKSVIVNNRPLLKDPMVVTDNGTEVPDKEPAKPVAPSKTEPESAEPKSKSEPKPEPEAKLKPKPEKVVEPSPGTATKADKPEEPDEVKPPEPDSGESDDSAGDKTETSEEEDQAPAKDSAQQLEAEAAAEAEHQEATAKLADSKQYYLSINTVEKRKAKRFVVLGVLLAIILMLAWADIALDAGLIRVHGIKPITHLFSN